MEPWQQRVLEERDQLQQRLQRLEDFNGGPQRKSHDHWVSGQTWSRPEHRGRPHRKRCHGFGRNGDALAGMLGAMLCTDSPAYDTACAAAFWHGLAGDRLASQAPDGTVLRATDVIAELNHTKKDMRTDIRRSWPLYPLIPCFWQNPSEPPKTLLYPTC